MARSDQGSQTSAENAARNQANTMEYNGIMMMTDALLVASNPGA